MLTIAQELSERWKFGVVSKMDVNMQGCHDMVLLDAIGIGDVRIYGQDIDDTYGLDGA